MRFVEDEHVSVGAHVECRRTDRGEVAILLQPDVGRPVTPARGRHARTRAPRLSEDVRAEVYAHRSDEGLHSIRRGGPAGGDHGTAVRVGGSKDGVVLHSVPFGCQSLGNGRCELAPSIGMRLRQMQLLVRATPGGADEQRSVGRARLLGILVARGRTEHVVRELERVTRKCEKRRIVGRFEHRLRRRVRELCHGAAGEDDRNDAGGASAGEPGQSRRSCPDEVSRDVACGLLVGSWDNGSPAHDASSASRAIRRSLVAVT